MSSQGTSIIQCNSSQLEFLAKETNRLHRNLSMVQSPVLSVHKATVERNLWQKQTQEGWPSASTIPLHYDNLGILLICTKGRILKLTSLI